MKSSPVCIFIKIILLLASRPFPLFCRADNTLKPGEFLAINDTLVSDGGKFVLGFFSPTNTTTDLYIGIWYRNVLQQGSVIWVANREQPIKDSSAALHIFDDNNLAILDAKGTLIWKSNLTSSPTSQIYSTEAILEDTGNFFLRDAKGTILWQTFDYPSDTFIPGMKLAYSYKSNTSNRLISWKNLTDPSPGYFSFGFDANTYIQLFIWQGSKPYWRSSPWNGKIFSGIALSSFAAYITYISTNDENYLTLTVSDASDMVRIKLEHSGNLELLAFNASSRSWETSNSISISFCNMYGWCGPFGYCDNIAAPKTCKCLEGFEPNVLSEWNDGKFSGGCTRKKALKCGLDDFRQLQSMKVPDRFVILRNKSTNECKTECVNNCSCTAYAFANLTTGDSTIPRCLLWMKELIDTEYLGSGGEDLYLRLASSELGLSGLSGGNNKSRKLIVAAAVVSSAIFSLACGYLAWKCFSCKIGNLKDETSRILKKYWSSETEFPKKLPSYNGFGEGDPDNSQELPLVDFKYIALLTENFSDSNKLGQGGFGKVYKGKLPDGQAIAVKRLTRGSGQGLEEFKNEVISIAKLQHRNLVRLLGCCIQGEERLLVYEYLPNKSLDVFLFDPKLKTVLDWERRFHIIKGIARALLYLHQDSRLRIIHRDLKASNILLDEEMKPKVSDFGMARIVWGNQHQLNTNRIVGTYGYMSPEYAMEGLYSMKSDIYSFGVLLLEIVSGFRNSSFHLCKDYPNILAYAWYLWNEGKGKELIDSSLAEQYSLDEVIRSICVGLLCVQDSPHDRPTVSSVVFMLENEIQTYPEPKEPKFTIHKNLEVYALNEPLDNLQNHSLNNVTITAVAGR